MSALGDSRARDARGSARPPALFDRLMPGEAPAQPIARIARDLSNLLNTRVTLLGPDPKRSRLIDGSVLCYGIPDSASVGVFGARAVEWLRTEIQHAITNFEPRLRQVQVSVIEQDVKTRTLAFRIEAAYEDTGLGYDARFTSRSSRFDVDRADPRLRVADRTSGRGRR